MSLPFPSMELYSLLRRIPHFLLSCFIFILFAFFIPLPLACILHTDETPRCCCFSVYVYISMSETMTPTQDIPKHVS